MPLGRQPDDVASASATIRNSGAQTVAVATDRTRAEARSRLFDAVAEALGPVTALVLSHAESVDSGLLDSSIECFDRHFAVNARASWLLVRELAHRFVGSRDRGRIVALTSDHTVGSVPCGASKGALDRIVIAAARELAELRITSDAINGGPIDTG